MKPERRKNHPDATHHPSKGRGILTAVITAGLTTARKARPPHPSPLPPKGERVLYAVRSFVINHRDGSCGLLLEGMKPERRKNHPDATHHPSKGRGILTAVITAGLTTARKARPPSP